MPVGPAGCDGCTEKKVSSLASDEVTEPRHPVNEVVPELQFRSEHNVSRLRTHHVFLRGDRVRMRPLTEDDWGLLLKWNNDPDVMEYAGHKDFKASSLGELQAIYRWISTHARCFIIEAEGRPIGEGWLQRMNLRRIVDQFSGKDLRRQHPQSTCFPEMWVHPSRRDTRGGWNVELRLGTCRGFSYCALAIQHYPTSEPG